MGPGVGHSVSRIQRRDEGLAEKNDVEIDKTDQKHIKASDHYSLMFQTSLHQYSDPNLCVTVAVVRCLLADAAN